MNFHPNLWIMIITLAIILGFMTLLDFIEARRNGEKYLMGKMKDYLNDLARAEASLIPFEVKAIHSEASEIPYGVKQIQATDIWDRGEKGSGIVVAILDTGIDRNHPDLKDQIIEGRNFTGEGSKENFADGNGHGTHVAGTIAAVENGSGVVGVAPEAKLLIGKVLKDNGSGSYASIIAGIEWATKWRGKNDERVRVISMSLGGSYNDPRMEKAILKAVSKGILVVVASGNEGDGSELTEEYGYPALYRECVTVAACDESGKLAEFSNNHKEVDMIAAGVDVLSTYPNSSYAVLSGTSMATPHISGALALIIATGEKQFKRELSEAEIFALLTKTSCSLGYEKSSEGNGLPALGELYKHC